MTPVQREARTFFVAVSPPAFLRFQILKKPCRSRAFPWLSTAAFPTARRSPLCSPPCVCLIMPLGQSAFTYQDPHLRIVFMQENLSQQEQIILLSHELGHILCRHLKCSPATGPGSSVLQEQEANEFASILLRYNRRCRPRRIACGAASV